MSSGAPLYTGAAQRTSAPASRPTTDTSPGAPGAAAGTPPIVLDGAPTPAAFTAHMSRS